MAPQKRRETLVKAVLGKAKSSTSDLPDSGHVYGLYVEKDKEGAAAALSSWNVSKPTAAKRSNKDLVKTNTLAIQNGNVNAKQMNEFAKRHPNILLKPPKSKLRNKTMSVNSEPILPNGTCFGARSAKSMPVRDIIEARFTDYSSYDTDYPDISSIAHSRKFPVQRQTRASARCRAAVNVEKMERPRFVMQKFKSVPSKFQSH